MSNTGMKVRVFDMAHGLVEHEDVKTIRIISKDYNLLIMKDYLSVIGEIVGSVDIKGDNVDLSFKGIKAFYMNSKNVFNLMIMFSANLGVLNLLPFPALDGGRILLLLWEIITGKPLNTKFEILINVVSMALLMAFMVFVVFNDLTLIF